MKFNHLNVPGHWKQYWTRYPEGHTIIEALISWVSQVDSMVDNQNNLNDNVAQFRKEIDDFVKLFDERLQEEVIQTLSDWQTSGFINVVISAALQWELDDYKARNEQDKISIKQQLADIVHYNNRNIFGGNRFSGHRGCGYAPENTMAAFRLAKRIGFQIIETDLMKTADDVFVLFHDGELDNLTTGTGRLDTKTYSELQNVYYDNAKNINDFPPQKIPTLKELLVFLNANNMYLTLELKYTMNQTDANNVYEMLTKYNMEDKTIIFGYAPSNIILFKNIDKNIKVALSLNADISQTEIDLFNTYFNKGDGFGAYYNNTTKNGVDLAHDNGYFVIMWNVNNVNEAKKCFEEYQAEYILSDYVSEVVYNGTH